MTRTVYSTYDYHEIIARYLAILDPLEGPSCFPFCVHLDAGNKTEPPVISVDLYETQSDGSDRVIAYTGCDQNTTLKAFHRDLLELKDDVAACVYAASNGTTYDKAVAALKEEAKKDESELPF